jgi:hypothetical protein
MAIASPGIIKATNDALVAIRPAINVVKDFAFDLSSEFATPGTTVKVPVVSTGALKAFDRTSNNFETVDGSLAWETVTLDDPVKSTFQIMAKDMLEMPMASYWTTIAKASANAVNKYISDKIGGLFTDSAVTATASISGDITAKKVAKLRTACTGRVDETVLMLDPDSYADLLGELDSSVFGGTNPFHDGRVDKLFGFASIVEARSLPTGTKGVLLPKDCLCTASRAYEFPAPDGYLECGTAKDEETGFTMTAMRHIDPKTGDMFLNLVSLFGMKLLQADKIVRIVAA